MKDKNGNEIVEPNEPVALTQEELINKAVSAGLDAQKNVNQSPTIEPEIDPFDFSDTDFNIDGNQQDQQLDPADLNNPNNDVNFNIAPVAPQQLYDPRVDDMIASNLETAKTTKMTSFMMELNNSLAGLPDEFGSYRNDAINEAKKSINSGQYIPANDMLSYLHGKSAMAKAKNIEPNPNPSIGGRTDLNPSLEEKPFDPYAPEVSAEDLEEKFKNVVF